LIADPDPLVAKPEQLGLLLGQRRDELARALSRGERAPHGAAQNPAGRVDFVCECSEVECRAEVSLTIDEYEFIRRNGRRFVVRLGHIDEESERLLVEEPGRFAVVEKFGPTGDVVAHFDPRSVRRRSTRRATS
jgi:hypothetical protein